MEEFLETLTSQLQEKFEAYENGKYTPFLAEVSTFEVLEPRAREVPFESLVANRLDAILARVEQLETGSQSWSRIRAKVPEPRSTTYLVVPVEHEQEAIRGLSRVEREATIIRYGEIGGRVAFGISLPHPSPHDGPVNDHVNAIAAALGGERGLPQPFDMLKDKVERDLKAKNEWWTAARG